MKKNYNVGDKVWFEYDDGSIMGWTITKTHPTSYRDDNGKTVQSTMVYMNPDDASFADGACYEHEIYNDGLPDDDERVIAYESKRRETLDAEATNRLFNVAVDCILELTDGWDWICEEVMLNEEENAVCEKTCQNLTRDCVIRLLMQRAKKQKKSKNNENN